MFSDVFKKKHSIKVRSAGCECWYIIKKYELDDEEFEYLLEDLKDRLVVNNRMIRKKELAELARLKAKYENG